MQKNEDGDAFKQALENVQKANKSWVTLALALRESSRQMAERGGDDLSAAFQRRAAEQLQKNEGVIARYFAVLEFLERRGIVKPAENGGIIIPDYVHASFSKLEIAARIEKFSSEKATEAIEGIKDGLVSVRGLAEKLKQLVDNHSETKATRRSKAARTRRDRLQEGIKTDNLRNAIGALMIQSAHRLPSYCRCEYVAALQNDTFLRKNNPFLPNKSYAGVSIINITDFEMSRRSLEIEDALLAAIASATVFAWHYIVFVGNDDETRRIFENLPNEWRTNEIPFSQEERAVDIYDPPDNAYKLSLARNVWTKIDPFLALSFEEKKSQRRTKRSELINHCRAMLGFYRCHWVGVLCQTPDGEFRRLHYPREPNTICRLDIEDYIS